MYEISDELKSAYAELSAYSYAVTKALNIAESFKVGFDKANARIGELESELAAANEVIHARNQTIEKMQGKITEQFLEIGQLKTIINEQKL